MVKRKAENEPVGTRELFLPPKIAMSVVLVTLNKHIDLLALACRTENAHYDKKRFAACIVRTGMGVGLFFASGTVVLTFGHLDLLNVIEPVFMGKIRAIDDSVRKVNTRIVTTTVACGVNSKLYLNRVQRAAKNKKEIKFEPELFPGMTKSVTIGNNDKIKFTLFCSGKYNILGCKSLEEIEKAYEYSVQWMGDFIKR